MRSPEKTRGTSNVACVSVWCDRRTVYMSRHLTHRDVAVEVQRDVAPVMQEFWPAIDAHQTGNRYCGCVGRHDCVS